MKRLAATVVAFAMLFLAQPDIAAYARGAMGASSGHIGSHFRMSPRRGHQHFARHNRNQNLWPWYGGYYALPPYASGDDDVTSTAPATVMYVPARAPNCHKIQEAMTVPSEDGGTRQVTVTRCQGS